MEISKGHSIRTPRGHTAMARMRLDWSGSCCVSICRRGSRSGAESQLQSTGQREDKPHFPQLHSPSRSSCFPSCLQTLPRNGLRVKESSMDCSGIKRAGFIPFPESSALSALCCCTPWGCKCLLLVSTGNVKVTGYCCSLQSSRREELSPLCIWRLAIPSTGHTDLHLMICD